MSQEKRQEVINRLQVESAQQWQQQEWNISRTVESQGYWALGKISVFRALNKVDNTFDEIQVLIERSIRLDE